MTPKRKPNANKAEENFLNLIKDIYENPHPTHYLVPKHGFFFP